MRSIVSRALVLAVIVAASLGLSACRRTYVIVPRPERGYSPMDTLRGRSDGRDVRVTFHFDTTYRVDTVTRLDTLWRDGARTDTLKLVRIDTLKLVRADTVYVSKPAQGPTSGIPVNVPQPDTVRIAVRDTVWITRRDTLRLTVRDTLRITVRDTVRLVARDTVRLAGRRMLFVPPGHYPPAGECRVWIHDRPPGQQDRAAPCNALGTIPAGAFILFGGEAWDADFDWVAEATRGAVPPEIVALSRRRGGRP